MTLSVLIRSTRSRWLLPCLLGCAVPSVCVAVEPASPAAFQVNIAPPIRLPIVDAIDNRFLRLSTSEGVSQLKVDSIVQDDAGFLWFGTHFGLYRYDGYAFKVFFRDAGNPNSLDCMDVRALLKDRDGPLWIGCAQSLDKLDQATETFKRYPIPLATRMTQDTGGLLWVATPRGLYRVDPISGAIQHYTHDPNDPASISSNDLSYCGEDKAGSLLLASNGGLDEFDRHAGKVIRHFVLPDVQASHTEEGLEFGFYEDRFGLLWIFHSSPNPLAVFDRNSNTLTSYAFPEREPTATRVQAMVEDRQGALWIATHGLGLLKLDREQGRFIRYTNVPADPESLPQDKLDAVFADREGNIWVAPGRTGPALLAAEPAHFQKLPKVPGSTLEPFIGALYEDRQGVLWIGTPEALIRREPKTHQITAYQAGGPAVYTDVVSIAEDGSGNLWVGTYGHGLHRFDRRTGKFYTYRHNAADPYSLSNDIVMRVLVDHNGTLWAGTADGLDRFDPATERFNAYKLDSHSLLILELTEDREGKIWIGTDSSGLRRFDPVTGQLATYEHVPNDPDSLSDDRVNSVHFDRSGTMWVGTQNGLDRLDPHTGRVSTLTQREGLPGNAVGCILEDKSGNLWMSTNNGVGRFNVESKTFASFSTAQGLPGPNLTGWGACFQSASGEMFFGGYNGGTSFSPDKVADSSYAAPIVLTDFRLFGNPVQIGADSPLRKSISYTSDLTLSHQQNVFSIAFAALGYASPATNRYRYRLEGLERDWNEVGSDRRQAIYTTLPPGKYTFRAQAATTGGPWSEPGAALRITVEAPWWARWEFRALLGAAALALAVSIYLYRVQRITRALQIRFDERVRERTRIARDLHDSLLQGFQGLTLKFHALAHTMAQGSPVRANIEANLRQARQLIEDVRTRVLELRTQDEPPAALEDRLKEFRDIFPNASSTAFEMSVVGETRTLDPIAFDEALHIGREAISNAVTHAHASRIDVELTYRSRDLTLRVSDNGKGMDANTLQSGRAGHWGLQGMRERARSLGAVLEVWSRPGAGTDIQLVMPAAAVYGRRHSEAHMTLTRRLMRAIGRGGYS